MCKSELVRVGLDYGCGITKSLILLPANSLKSKDPSDPEINSRGASFRGILHSLENLVWAQSRIRSKEVSRGALVDLNAGGVLAFVGLFVPDSECSLNLSRTCVLD